jgi:hypothetical protein
MGVEVVEFLGAEVEEVDVKKDAVGGVVAGLADLFDLGLGEVGVGWLGAERCGESEEREGEGERAGHEATSVEG